MLPHCPHFSLSQTFWWHNFIRVASVKEKLSLFTVPSYALAMSSLRRAEHLRSKGPSVFTGEQSENNQVCCKLARSGPPPRNQLLSLPTMSLLNQCMFSGYNNTISTPSPPWKGMFFHSLHLEKCQHSLTKYWHSLIQTRLPDMFDY